VLALVPPVPGPVGPRCWVARRARIGGLTSARSSLISRHLAGRHPCLSSCWLVTAAQVFRNRSAKLAR
jgi:hypothetical protein